MKKDFFEYEENIISTSLVTTIFEKIRNAYIYTKYYTKP